MKNKIEKWKHAFDWWLHKYDKEVGFTLLLIGTVGLIWVIMNFCHIVN